MEHLKETLLQKKGYPNAVMALHSLHGLCAWRAAHSAPVDRLDPDRQASLLYHLVSSFFANGYGGSHARDWAMGVSPGLFASNTVAPGWIAAFAAVYFSPADLVYAQVARPGPVRTVVHVYESIDGTTGVLNSYNKAAKLFPRNPVAPWAAALAYGIGGAYFRMLERAHRGLPTTTEHYDAIRARARVVLAYVAAYTTIRRARGHDAAQVLVVLFEVARKLSQLYTGPRREPHPSKARSGRAWPAANFTSGRRLGSS